MVKRSSPKVFSFPLPASGPMPGNCSSSARPVVLIATTMELDLVPTDAKSIQPSLLKSATTTWAGWVAPLRFSEPAYSGVARLPVLETSALPSQMAALLVWTKLTTMSSRPSLLKSANATPDGSSVFSPDSPKSITLVKLPLESVTSV